MNGFPFTIIDLTHTLSGNNPTWSGTQEFKHVMAQDHDMTKKYKFRKHLIDMAEGCGTHMDAPSHCQPGGKDIDQIPLESLIAPCFVIDVSDKATADYIVSADDITAFEKKYSKISAGSFVIIHSGWDQFWNNSDQYRNGFVFPSVSPEAARLLLDRDIAGLGVDTLSPDCGPEFEVHNIMLGNGRYLVENVANSGNLPPFGSFALVMPIKTQNGTEAPIRLAALVPKVL